MTTKTAESYRDTAARIVADAGRRGLTQSELEAVTGWPCWRGARVGRQIAAEGRAVLVLGGMYDEPRLYAPGFEP